MFDHLAALFIGLLIGFIMAIPVGPVGLIVFQRSMFKSRRLGMTAGIGAAIGDGLLASVGAFSIRVVWLFIHEFGITIRIIGGLFILILGLVAIFSKNKIELNKKYGTFSYIEHFVSGLGLTITNPIAAFSFFIIFARIGRRLGLGGPGVALGLVIGVTLGSLLWWLFLTYIAQKIGHKIKAEHIDIINKCFGLAITIIGAAMVLGAIFK